MSSAPDNCRLYVCKSTFGSLKDECIRFYNLEQYQRWCKAGNTDNYVFQPVCNRMEMFDKMVLMMKSGKLGFPHIVDFIGMRCKAANPPCDAEQ